MPLTLATGLMQAGCAPEPGTEIHIGTNLWAGYEPLYLARNLGWLNDTGIRLVEYPTSMETMSALQAGSIDAGALTLDETLSLAERSMDLRVVLLLDVSNGADAVLAQPDVTAAGLTGKRIGVESSAVGGYVLDRMLDRFGLTLGDVQIVPLTADRHEVEFDKRSIDAVVTFEPVKSRLVARGGHVIFDSSQIPGEIMDVLVVRADALKGGRKVLDKLVKAWFASLDYMREHPADAMQRMRPRLNLSEQEMSSIFSGLQMGDRTVNRRFFDRHADTATHKASHLMQVMVANGLLGREVDVQLLFQAGMAGHLAEAE